PPAKPFGAEGAAPPTRQRPGTSATRHACRQPCGVNGREPSYTRRGRPRTESEMESANGRATAEQCKSSNRKQAPSRRTAQFDCCAAERGGSDERRRISCRQGHPRRGIGKAEA